MSANLSWLTDGIDLSKLFNGDSGVMPLVADDCTSDSCSQYVCGGDGGCSSYSSCSTDGVIVYDDDDATVSYSVTPTTVTIYVTRITSRSYARTVRCVKGNTRYENTLSAYSTSTSFSFTGLDPETSYYFEVGIRAPDGTRTFYEKVNGDGYVTTSSYDYSLSFTTSATSSTVSATVTLTSGTVNYDIDCNFTLDGARTLDATISAGSTSRTRTWTTNITPATVYEVGLTDNLRSKSWTTKRRTKNNFKWSTTVAKGATFNLLASDWNDYTTQLKTKAAYYGRNYSPATVATGDQLTATKMNNIAAVVNWLVDNNKGDCKTKLAHVDVGDVVTADKINALATCLNE